jgi:hypothetical protein
MRKRDNTLERYQIYLPKDYPWDLIRYLTEASSSTEVLRCAVMSYSEVFDCDRHGRNILIMNQDGLYAKYKPSETRHDDLKRINLTIPQVTKGKIEFMAAATAQDSQALIRDALAFYRQIVIEAAFQRPIMAEQYGERTRLLFASLVNVANMAKGMGLGTKKPEIHLT